MYFMTASLFPSTWALVIASSMIVEYTNAAPEPIAISVSIFGAPWNRLLKPLMKNFWLITMTMPASSICTIPIAT